MLFVSVTIGSEIVLADENLSDAIDAWLADDDERAIPALAELAKSGNVDAQILLGQINRRPGAPSNYLGGFSRKEQNALMKAPGGLSGVPWLSVIETDNQTAVALRNASDPKFRLKGIEALLDLEEGAPTILPIIKQLNDGNYAKTIRLSGHENFPADVRFVAWLAALLVDESEYSAQRTALLTEWDGKLAEYDVGALIVLPGSQSLMTPEEASALASQFAVAKVLRALAYERGDLEPVSSLPGADQADRVLLEDEALKPLAGLCADECPQSGITCVRTLYYGVGGFMGLLALQTPLERLIPSEVYLGSERYKSDIKRKAFMTVNESWGARALKFYGAKIDRQADQCIVNSVLASSGQSR
ncbi:hypothetical protein [Roseibium aggregatum]|uniref:Uncharacterized protein n=1 Tax=Roseibium aggregatum TaxID=187304 RepID=A0A939EBA4_9HYPH|nr:hypothetical protein [Roseibium aggregatum]MBN9668918.1 hypothetical protein [Roseibium aggregatum]